MGTQNTNRSAVDAALRKSGIVVVMNKSHVRNAEDVVTTMTEVYNAGLVAEVTFRIDEAILREAMQELVRKREESPPESPFLLGVGSVINPRELEAAIEMGFNMIVAPANVMGGYGEGMEFVKTAHAADVFAAPAVFTPTEFQYFVEREDGLEPDAIKVFPARSHGPKGVSDLLAPYVRERHRQRIIMPTGAVDYQTGPEYISAISKRGYTPVLGMSAPLKPVAEHKEVGNRDFIRQSLKDFNTKFKENCGM